MRLTFKWLENWARKHGWIIEKDGQIYQYWRVNDQGCGPVDGVECEASSLADVYSDIYSEVVGA